MTVPPSESVLSMMLAHDGASAQSDAQRVRETTAARLVVRGKATRGASGWKVQLTAMPAQGMELPVEFQGQDAVPAARGATDLLLAALGRALPPESERETAFDETLQRARAAMLANELDTARTILTSSPQLAQLARAVELSARASRFPRRPTRSRGKCARRRARTGRGQGRSAISRAGPYCARRDTRAPRRIRGRRAGFRSRDRIADAGRKSAASAASRWSAAATRACRASLRRSARRFRCRARRARKRGRRARRRARRCEPRHARALSRPARRGARRILPAAADRFQSFGALHELLLTLTGVIDAQLAMLQHDAAWPRSNAPRRCASASPIRISASISC